METLWFVNVLDSDVFVTLNTRIRQSFVLFKFNFCVNILIELTAPLF